MAPVLGGTRPTNFRARRVRLRMAPVLGGTRPTYVGRVPQRLWIRGAADPAQRL